MLERYSYLVAHPFRKLYWFLFRPKTAGVKCVLEASGKILGVRHAYGKRKWTFPGGRIEKGESPEDAARREIKEELGVELADIRLLCKHYTTKEYKRDTVYCFAAWPLSTDFRIAKAEIAETQWFLPNEFPAPQSSIVPVMLEAYQEDEKNRKSG
ncbi:NUDIX domain-containing protein [Candidatus Azambacteria bacterium]|nr:NUDIX domain-containing protein [Candidatus Azambacteria bacterium]